MHHLTLKPAAETQLTNQTNSTTVSSPVLAIVLWPGRVGKKEVAAAAGVPSWPDTVAARCPSVWISQSRHSHSL